jgi:hypothetical protein
MKKFTLAMWLMTMVGQECFTQASNFVYAIDNPSTGSFQFSKIDLTTHAITHLSQAPISSWPSEGNAFIDYDSKIYFLNTGYSLVAFDALTGTIKANISYSMGPLWYAALNPCDSNVYGLINNGSNPPSFVRVSPKTGATTVISSLPTMLYSVGAMSFVDPLTNIYTFQSENLVGVNITTGQVAYNTYVTDLPNEIFGHIALKSGTHEIFGTSANTSFLGGLKYLSTVNPNTGVVTHVSDVGWNVGVWKPLGGGDCIDQTTGTYYYSGYPNLVVAVNTTSGDIISGDTIASGDLLCVQYFSRTSCVATNINEAAEDYFQVYPNPVKDILNIELNKKEDIEVALYQPTGQKVFQQTFSGSTAMNLEQLTNGIYFYEIRNKLGIVKQGKLVKG